MRMKWAALAWATILAWTSPLGASEPLDLKVLYAGHSGTDREKDFLTFLERHVQRVATTDFRTVDADCARDFDVVVFDWDSIYPRDSDGRIVAGAGSLNIPTPPALSRDFDRPAILIGQAGGSVANVIGLKATGLCLCLEDAAHDMVVSHEVFREPIRVAVAYDERLAPPAYHPLKWSATGLRLLLAGSLLMVASLLVAATRFLRQSPAIVVASEVAGDRRDRWTVGLGIIAAIGLLTTCAGIVVTRQGVAATSTTLPAWRIQTKSHPAIDPGLVYDPYGFEDSPDAEIIASGLNGKDPRALALGRQGNFLVWGFSGAPTEMTPGGRSLFLNALCYIRKFDGAGPLVYREQRSREWALVYARKLDRDGYDDDLASRLFPTELRERFGADTSKYVAYYDENLEYLRPTPIGFSVDEEVKTLGVSNRRIELLERCISNLARGEQSDLAARILRRYTRTDPGRPEAWQAWLRANRDRLYFTDVGGFTFKAAPGTVSEEAVTHDDRGPVGSTRGSSDWLPVTAGAEILPRKARPDSSVELVVRVRVAPGWHIDAAAGSTRPGIPTTLRLSLPQGISAEGEWIKPRPSVGADGQELYGGDVEFRHRLRVDARTSGVVKVTCELAYQACNPFSCQAPMKVDLEAITEVVADRPAGKSNQLHNEKVNQSILEREGVACRQTVTCRRKAWPSCSPENGPGMILRAPPWPMPCVDADSS